MFRKFLRIHLRHSSATVTAGEMIASFHVRIRIVAWVIGWKLNLLREVLALSCGH